MISDDLLEFIRTRTSTFGTKLQQAKERVDVQACKLFDEDKSFGLMKSKTLFPPNNMLMETPGGESDSDEINPLEGMGINQYSQIKKDDSAEYDMHLSKSLNRDFESNLLTPDDEELDATIT